MNRDDIIRMAKEAGFERTKMHGALERFAYIVAAAEREACAKVLEKISTAPDMQAYAAAIRDRGQHEH